MQIFLYNQNWYTQQKNFTSRIGALRIILSTQFSQPNPSCLCNPTNCKLKNWKCTLVPNAVIRTVKVSERNLTLHFIPAGKRPSEKSVKVLRKLVLQQGTINNFVISNTTRVQGSSCNSSIRIYMKTAQWGPALPRPKRFSPESRGAGPGTGPRAPRPATETSRDLSHTNTPERGTAGPHGKTRPWRAPPDPLSLARSSQRWEKKRLKQHSPSATPRGCATLARSCLPAQPSPALPGSPGRPHPTTAAPPGFAAQRL